MNSLVINLFGGPGTGKSTLASIIFSKLKMLNIDVEMAPEYVKDLVWEESFKKIENQIYIFGKQHNRMFRLKSKVKVIITDSPLINSIVYYNGDNPHFKDLILWEYNKMNNLSFYLERSFEYSNNGRVQSLDEAIDVDIKYKDILDSNLIDYISIRSPYDVDMIVNLVNQKLNGTN
jgi:nicotinamide riboside kinase